MSFFIKRTKQWLLQTEQVVSTYFFTGQYTEDANGNYRIAMNTKGGGITLEQGFPLDYAAANLATSGESSALDLPGNYLNSASYNGLDSVNPGESGGVLIIKPSTTNCANNDGNCLDIANSTLEIPYHAISIDATATMAVDRLSDLNIALSGKKPASDDCNDDSGFGNPLMLACGFSNNSQCPIETRQKYKYYDHGECAYPEYFYTNNQVTNGSVGTYDPVTFAFTGFNKTSLTSPLIKYGYSPLSIIQTSLPNPQNNYTQNRYGSWVATKANDDSGSLYIGTGGNDINRVLYNAAKFANSKYNFFNPNRKACTYHVLEQTTDAGGNTLVTYAPESSCVQDVVMFLQIAGTDSKYDDSKPSALFYYIRNGNTLVSPFRYGTRQLPNIRITYPANFSNDFIGAK